jgi:hypothetical protein
MSFQKVMLLTPTYDQRPLLVAIGVRAHQFLYKNGIYVGFQILLWYKKLLIGFHVVEIIFDPSDYLPLDHTLGYNIDIDPYFGVGV